MKHTKRSRPYCSILTDYVRLELFKNNQKRLRSALAEKTPVSELDKTVFVCDVTHSPASIVLEREDGGSKKYFGWREIIKRFTKHVHGASSRRAYTRLTFIQSAAGRCRSSLLQQVCFSHQELLCS